MGCAGNTGVWFGIRRFSNNFGFPAAVFLFEVVFRVLPNISF